jgi:F0F1-type ATP synthase gamma subunit
MPFQQSKCLNQQRQLQLTLLIDLLKLTYNTARQAAITKEFLEIVGRAEALKG